MPAETHSQIAAFIWSICNLLRGPYKRNEYRKVILPLTVLRRFDCILAPTKAAALKEHAKIEGKSENIVRHKLSQITGHSFYNLSKLDFPRLLDDPGQLASHLNAYINSFSPNVRAIMERFAFDQQIAKMAEKDLLYLVIKRFAAVDLSPQRIDNVQMGYVFEELIRIGAEQANEEAGEHFTPREVIKLMVNLLLSPEQDLRRSHVVKTIYDPACGTGGMLSVAEQYIRRLNKDAQPKLFGQDWNDEAWAICRSDMLIKDEDAENIILGDSFTKDGFARDQNDKKWTFDYMLANPPFGVEWKQQQRAIEKEHDSLSFEGRFGAGLPRVNDGALLFLQHMLSKMVAQMGMRATCNQSMAAICPDSAAYPRFLYWLLASQYEHIRNMAGGEQRDGLNLEILGSIPCLKAPLVEQRAIAAFLDRETKRLDRLVAKRRTLVERLKEKRAALISRTVTCGLPVSPSKQASFPLDPPFKPSGLDWLGDIPSHWEVKPLKRAINFVEGPGIMAADFTDDGVPLLRISCIGGRRANLDGCNFVSEQLAATKWAHFRVKPRDLLISGSASTGFCSEVDDTTAGAIPYTGIIIIRPLSKNADRDFIRWYFLSNLFLDQAALAKTGSTIQHFGPTHLSKMFIALPSLSEQTAIAEYLDAETRRLDVLVAKVESAVERLQEYRTALIIAAVTGKIDVRNAVEIA